MSIMFQQMGAYDSTKRALDDAEKLYASVNSIYGLTMVAENRGGMYMKKGQYLDTLTYFNEAKEGFEQLGYDADVAYISLEIRSRIAADLHDEVGSSVSSIRMLSEIALHKANDDPAHLHDLLGKINENAKDIVENTSDAVKYSGTPSLNASIKIVGGNIQMEIQDFGKGFDADTVDNGNGLGNMIARAKDLGGLLQIHSTPGSGTHI